MDANERRTTNGVHLREHEREEEQGRGRGSARATPARGRGRRRPNKAAVAPRGLKTGRKAKRPPRGPWRWGGLWQSRPEPDEPAGADVGAGPEDTGADQGADVAAAPDDEGAAVPLCDHPTIHAHLPAAGPGYYADGPALHRYGERTTIQALRVIGRLWAAAHPGGPRLGVGTISPRCGGQGHPHGGHRLGIDVDIRPLRADGREAPVTAGGAGYSRRLTQELVHLILRNPLLPVHSVSFADPGLAGTHVVARHHDHLHVRFAPPRSPRGG